jgi:hypothetical protein
LFICFHFCISCWRKSDPHIFSRPSFLAGSSYAFIIRIQVLEGVKVGYFSSITQLFLHNSEFKTSASHCCVEKNNIVSLTCRDIMSIFFTSQNHVLYSFFAYKEFFSQNQKLIVQIWLQFVSIVNNNPDFEPNSRYTSQLKELACY